MGGITSRRQEGDSFRNRLGCFTRSYRCRQPGCWNSRGHFMVYSSTASFCNTNQETNLRQYSRPCKREDIRICRLSANKSRVVYFVPKSKLVPVIRSSRHRESLRSYVQERADKAPLVEALALSPELLLKTWTSRNQTQPDCDISSASSPSPSPWSPLPASPCQCPVQGGNI